MTHQSLESSQKCGVLGLVAALRDENDRGLIQFLHARLQSFQPELESKFVWISGTAAIPLDVLAFPDCNGDEIERRRENDCVQCVEECFTPLRIQENCEIAISITHFGRVKNHGVVAKGRDLQARHRRNDLIYIPVGVTNEETKTEHRRATVNRG